MRVDIIIWRKIAADGDLPTRGYDRPFRIRRPCLKPLRLSHPQNPTAPRVSISGFDGASRVLFPALNPVAPLLFPPQNQMAPSVSRLRDPMALLVSLPCDPMAPVLSPPRDSAMSVVYPPRVSAAPLVSPLRGLAASPVIRIFVLVMPAADLAPAPVLRTAKPLFFRLIHLHSASRRGPHRQHRCCPSCQVCQSTSLPAIWFHLQACLAGPPLNRRRDSFCLNRFLCYPLARVRKHAVYLYHIIRFSRHFQRRP